jgi:hypothetical protein
VVDVLIGQFPNTGSIALTVPAANSGMNAPGVLAFRFSEGLLIQNGWWTC